MAFLDETTKYGKEDLSAREEEFSLEDILAEYGSSREQRLMEDVERAAEQTTAPTAPKQEPSAEEEAPQQEQPPIPQPPPEKSSEPAKPSVRKKEPPKPAPKSEPELPPVPKPISLEDVVGSTIDAVMEERKEQEGVVLLKPKPKRSLFSRRKLEETEQLYDSGEPEPEPVVEIESIGPELEPYEAAEQHRKAYQRLNGAVFPALLLSLLAVIPMAVELYGVEIPYWTGDLKVQSVVELALLAITAVLCRGVFTKGFSMMKRKRCVSELLVSLAALVTAADCAAWLLLPGRTAVLPYAAAACLGLTFAQWGVSREQRGLYDTFHAAAVDDPPYLVTDTEKGACKQRGALPGFYTTAMKDDVSTMLQTALLPVVLMGTLVFAGLSSLGQGRDADFLLNWSVLLIAGGTCSLPLCWSLPFSRFARHLQRVGCAVAGWSGAEKLSRKKSMIVTDGDLFPPGTIQLNGIKIYGEERGKIASYAAAMARQSGCGLERLFDSFQRSESARYVQMEDFRFYEEGGWSGTLRGETVLMGTASFMRKMEVRLPADVNLKTGIFLSIDRQLAAVFAVKYHSAENVDFALMMLRRSHILPILAARDPNITPTLLKRKFHKGVKGEYPDLTSRVALSEAEQDRDLPRALLFREGLMPYAETVAGSKRLCQAVRRSTAVSLLGSILGTLLVFYLVFQAAYLMMTPLAVDAFLLLWTLPVLLLSDWTGRY